MPSILSQDPILNLHFMHITLGTIHRLQDCISLYDYTVLTFIRYSCSHLCYVYQITYRMSCIATWSNCTDYAFMVTFYSCQISTFLRSIYTLDAILIGFVYNTIPCSVPVTTLLWRWDGECSQKYAWACASFHDSYRFLSVSLFALAPFHY